MYYQHFRLTGPPFLPDASPAHLFQGREHGEALAALKWSLLHEPSGYALLVGEPGTGKTTLIKWLLLHQFEQVSTVYLNHPRLPFPELMSLAMRQLKIDPAPESKAGCLEAWRSYLWRSDPEHRAAIIIDEAQHLNIEVFEELRLLFEYARLDGGQLKLILIGQPSLLRMLESQSLMHFNQRIGARAILNPMRPAEACEYIEHHLSARNGRAKKIFARAALNEIVERSGGIPRRINVLCHNSMLAAYSRGKRKVGLDEVRSAASEYENLLAQSRSYAQKERGPVASNPRSRIAVPGFAFGLALLTGIGLARLWLSPGMRHASRGIRLEAFGSPGHPAPSSFELENRKPRNPN